MVRRPFLVRWLTSLSGGFKINIDGATFGNLEPAGCGGFLRNAVGDFILGFLVHIGTASNVCTKICGLKHELMLCYEMGIDNPIVESESLLLVNRTHHTSSPPWKYYATCDEILDLENYYPFDPAHQYRK